MREAHSTQLFPRSRHCLTHPMGTLGGTRPLPCSHCPLGLSCGFPVPLRSCQVLPGHSLWARGCISLCGQQSLPLQVSWRHLQSLTSLPEAREASVFSRGVQLSSSMLGGWCGFWAKYLGCQNAEGTHGKDARTRADRRQQSSAGGSSGIQGSRGVCKPGRVSETLWVQRE